MRRGSRGDGLSPGFSGLLVVCLKEERGSSTLLTLSSRRGWLSVEAGGVGEGMGAGGGSLAGRWQTSA